MMTEDVRRFDVAKQCEQHPQWSRDSKQPAFRSRLQGALSIIGMCLLVILSGYSDYQDGEEAYKRGVYATALKKL